MTAYCAVNVAQGAARSTAQGREQRLTLHCSGNSRREYLTESVGRASRIGLTVRESIQQAVKEVAEDDLAVCVADGCISLALRLEKALVGRVFGGGDISVVRKYPIAFWDMQQSRRVFKAFVRGKGQGI